MFNREGYIAASRFGLGVRPEEANKINKNPKKWLVDQVISGQKYKAPSNFMSTDNLIKEYIKRDKKKSQKDKKQLRRDIKNIYIQEFQYRYNLAVMTEQPFIERLVWFWGNHFTVSVQAKGQLRAVAGAYEREAIRPHVLGKFSDMLLAVEMHPAMLFYLDNTTSVGPNSKRGRRANKGLNENLAREILELHTLGVNGGYNQDDVISLAKIITGWNIVPPKQGGGGFTFINQIHEPGDHKMLGETYKQKGIKQGIAALTDLANHPSTAKFIATKLARYFISDDPPASAIKRLEKAFIDSKGDLGVMALELIEIDDVWNQAFSKVKTPEDMVISSLRLMGAGDNLPYEKVMQSMVLMENLPYAAPSPAGWPDKEDAWISPNAIMNRVEWCHAVAYLLGKRVDPIKLAEDLMGNVLSEQTLKWIKRAASEEEGLALLLASPEFQRR